MKTQKLLVVTTMMMAAISASAQYEPGTFSVQPRLGFTLSKISHIHPVRLESGVTLDTHPIGGLIIGADMDYQLSELFSLSAGINWAMAGCGWEDYEKKPWTHTNEDLIIMRYQYGISMYGKDLLCGLVFRWASLLLPI